ncbi:MAG: hypothetical protein F6K50_29665 [Moorea sp. SIO3I7]|uniref:DUF6335 family protein n=1 Tax=unclassified Moorena TaxID=2683338 RepID=UPI0013BF1188|nr:MULTISPECIES: DUF6335 family protein [unclassified Moorena]NEN99500.1 hypothetical protein [Moorena sp. SIO3I7]NEO10360.1 hypothetical protein [Moorena sp. SIO3I8]NEO20260.1 hypothetical protein [Moorena sp. SIO4A5]NEQ60198.1 hypothetical protein [Moorena sp. SIO4A1]
MKDYKNNDVVNSYEILKREEGYTDNRNTEEVFLADLTGIEDPDRIFEGVVDRDTGMGRTLEKLRTSKLSGGNVTGGDIYDNWYQAEVVGEEAVGGETPTPDQNVTEDLLESMGISSVDGEAVQTRDKLEVRDHLRWELNPESSEDYSQHLK